MWYEDLTFAGLSNLAINIHVFFLKYRAYKLTTLSFNAKIPEFYQVLSNILSKMSLRSYIQTVSFISHQKEQNGYNGCKTLFIHQFDCTGYA